MNTTVIKIGNVELTPKEALKLYESKQYIVTYSSIYQLYYSQAQQVVYGSAIFRKSPANGIGFSRRGSFCTKDAAGVNKLLGFKLVNE